MTETNTLNPEMNSRTEKFEIDDTTDISRNALLRPRARLAFFARSPPPRTTFAAILFLVMHFFPFHLCSFFLSHIHPCRLDHWIYFFDPWLTILLQIQWTR